MRWRVGEYKSAMGGSRNGIIVRSTCGRVNLTDATKISIKQELVRDDYTVIRAVTYFAFYSTKLSQIPLNFCDVVR